MRRMRIVNVIPWCMSDEIDFDAEPSIAVNPVNVNQMAITTMGTPPVGTGPKNLTGPIFYSIDGGETWELRYDIPGGNGDESPCFALTSSVLYVGTLPAGFTTQIMDVLRVRATRDGFGEMAPMSQFGTTKGPGADDTFDQPWVVATTVVDGPDHLYLGYNLHVGTKNQLAKIAVYLDASKQPQHRSVSLDDRTPNDSYEIRPAVHQGGTVYVAYKGVLPSVDKFDRLVNVVVARDDDWGAGDHPFTALVDPSDGKPGMIVAPDVRINERVNGGSLGGVRLGNDLAIAVDPTNSAIVYLAWGDTQNNIYTLRVRRSTNRGQGWSGDLLRVENATLACLAINDRGTVAFLYQQLVGVRMETHFRTTTDGNRWDDTLMARTLTAPPRLAGDFSRMLAVGPNFYGTFPAMNGPDPANFFPDAGGTVRYQRRTFGGLLLGLNGSLIKESVDPFFFKVLED